MLRKTSLPYAITALTQHGKHVLLEDNHKFDISHFSFIDDEINYGLFNNDHQNAKGFDRVDELNNDKITDIQSLAIFDPQSRFPEVANYLFGDAVKHQLKPEEIKTEADLEIDMMDGFIDPDIEKSRSNIQRKTDVVFHVVSGTFDTFKLDDQQIQQWSALIDLRALVTVHLEEGSVAIPEGPEFEDAEYHVHYQGGTTEKSFEYSVRTTPRQTISIGTQQFKSERNVGYAPYGTYYIYKTIFLEGKKYTSELLKIRVEEPDYIAERPILDGKSELLKKYASPYAKKHVFMNFETFNKLRVSPSINSIYINDAILKQNMDGYVRMSEPIDFAVKSSNINSLHIQLRHLLTGEVKSIFSLQGSAVDASRYITVPNLEFKLNLRRQAFKDGHWIAISAELPDNFGHLVKEYVSKNEFDYIYFNDQNLKVNMIVHEPIFLGTWDEYETTQPSNKLWQIFAEDQTVVFNYKQDRILTMDDYQNLVFYTW